jgi:hypothetical protein
VGQFQERFLDGFFEPQKFLRGKASPIDPSCVAKDSAVFLNLVGAHKCCDAICEGRRRSLLDILLTNPQEEEET